MATINYQVVWAKVRGYPWWPGVVIYKQIETTNSNKYQEASGDHLITLNFIGENTQYLLFSANLNSKFIKDFEKHYNRYSKTNNKFLSNCIKIAKQLLEGEISYTCIFDINKAFRHKRFLKPTASSKDIEGKLFELQNLIKDKDSKSNLKEPACLDVFQRHEKFLSEIAEHKSIENTGAKLCETLIELAKMNITRSTLSNSHIQELLKIVGELYIESNIPLVREIGKIVDQLRNYWKGVITSQELYDGYIVDKSLRNLVCRKIALALEANHFDRTDAREIALSIEEKIRKMDPAMGTKYRKCFRKMIREIKLVESSVYNQLKVQCL